MCTSHLLQISCATDCVGEKKEREMKKTQHMGARSEKRRGEEETLFNSPFTSFIFFVPLVQFQFFLPSPTSFHTVRRGWTLKKIVALFPSLIVPLLLLQLPTAFLPKGTRLIFLSFPFAESLLHPFLKKVFLQIATNLVLTRSLPIAGPWPIAGKSCSSKQ